MKKTLAVLFLGGACAAAMLGGDASAQDKKKGKDLPKSGGVIELLESKDGKFRFSVRDAEGKYLGGSAVGHATEAEAKEAAEELKKVIANAKYVSKKAEPAEKKSADKKEKD